MEKFLKQIQAILDATEKKIGEKNEAVGDIQYFQQLTAVQMCKVMVNAIVKYIEKQVAKTPDFEKLLNLEYKSAERMLKYVFGKAKALASPMANGMAACVPDEVVYDWVYEYYKLDDKAEYEEEQKKIAEAKAKKEAEEKAKAENKIKAREKAIKKLETSEGWAELSEEEKEKLISKEASDIEYKLNREIGKEKKPKLTSAKKPSKKTSKKEEVKAEESAETPTEEATEDNTEEPTPAPAGTVETPELSSDANGQLSLFDIAS